MNRDMLCSWLGVAPQSWPPDPYLLLGLPPGEADLGRIEQVVHERMCKLRCYQISHPEEATEGMNRLAQAFLCITEQVSRSTPRTVPPPAARTKAAAPPRTMPPPPSLDDTAVGRKTEVDWRQTPPPVRGPAAGDSRPTAPVAAVASTDATVELNPDGTPVMRAPAADATLPQAPASTSSSSSSSSVEMIPAVVLLARQSPEARRGLGTLKGLLGRISLTRRLLLAWKRVGRYLGSSSRQVSRAAEEDDLTHRMNVLFEILEDYPAFVGQPGQPGYRVAALARLEITAQMFKLLDEAQRKDLARDWKEGRKVLLEHRRFLLERFKQVKKRSRGSRLWQALRSVINEHPLLVSATALAIIAATVYFFTRGG